MNDAPVSVFLVVDLSLPALRCDVLSVGFERGVERPRKLGPRSVVVHVNVDLVWEQLSLGECAHRVFVEIVQNMIQASLRSTRMNESHLWRI